MRRLLHAVYALMLVTAPAAAQNPAIAEYHNPVWSPDGRMIAFEANRDGKYAVYTINFDGTNLRRLTSAQSNDVQPRWSPDGKQIVFVSDRDGRDQIYLMSADGSEQRPVLSARTPRQDFLPSFSPDGKWIAFGGQDTVRRMLYSIHVVRPDGSDHRALSDTSASAESPAWTTDGARIRYVSVPLMEKRPGEAPRDFLARRSQGTRSLSVLIDGSGVVPTKSEPDQSMISPDWKWRLAVRQGPAGAIYVIAWDTGAERLLVGTP